MQNLVLDNKKMNEKYWDKVAQDYDSEIFSVLANDLSDVIASKIHQLASKASIACDFGCGPGKFLPILAKNFCHVYALDISQVCLDQARDSCKNLRNISYSKIDLSKDDMKLKKVHFALCVNVAIMAFQKTRAAIFKTIAQHLHRTGHLLLVVPSLEAALYADFRLLQWNLKTGLKHSEAISELEETSNNTDLPLRQGIVDINGVPTKHYLKEELVALFRDWSFDILSIEKVEYSWKSEFDKPPKWMNGPYPWDWLVILEKTKN